VVSFDLIQYYFQTEVWVWPVIAISSLGAFWIYHRRVVDAMNVHRRELIENEHWLNEAQQIGNIGSWYRYIHGEKSRWSPQLCRIYGVSDNISPSFEWFLSIVHPDDLQYVKESFNLIHQTGESTVLNYRIIRDVDIICYVENTVKGAFDDDGELEAVYGSVLDVTERRISEENLKKALVEAESANRAKGAFLSSVSHEIRTPLNAIIGFSAIMAEQELTSEQYKSYGDLVNVAGKSLSSLVNDILDLSALESLSFTLVPVSLKINELMKEIDSVFKLIVEDKGIDFIIRQPENIPAVNIDGKRLRQILINIIGNAVKFTDKGKVEINVDVDSCSPGKHECDLIFKISDTGIGIKLKDQSRIFREFEQESGLIHRKFGGSGLGLSIVKQLLELMGGTIRLESEVGVGSAFTVSFLNVPISNVEEQDPVSPANLNDAASDWETSRAMAPALSTRDVGLHTVKNDFLNFNETSTVLIREAFGQRFAELSRGLSVELINALEVDLCTWAENLNDSELIEFSAMFSRAAAGMKVAELLKIAGTFRVN